MATWQNIPDDIISGVFKFIPLDKGTGRLVCTSWRDGIAMADRFRRSINLVGKDVSLQRVHQLFPHLRELQVELPRNTHPSALFLWESLESVKIETRWRTVHGHMYPPTVLAIDTSQLEPEWLQVYFKTHSPVLDCVYLPPEDWYARQVNTWERNWMLARAEEEFAEQYDILPDSEEEDFDPNLHRCNGLCNNGFKFGLKGVGVRGPAPIVHQAFGVGGKPLDWDAENEMVHYTHPNNIMEKLPFFTQCQVLACIITRNPHTLYISKDGIISSWLDAVVDERAVMFVQGFQAERVELHGTKVVKYRNDNRLNVQTPALLPEQPEFDYLVPELEEARTAAMNAV